MVEFSTSLLVGFGLSAILVMSALLGWLADLKRVGAATSARETTRRAAERDQPRPRAPFTSRSQPDPSASRGGPSPRTSAREQEERIRDAYFAKERKAREERERRRREQARKRTRQAAGGSTFGSRPQTPPPVGSDEARHRVTLELTGPLTHDSVRAAYRRLIAAYHPDRCATLGAKLQKLAEEETKRINEAYAYFRRVLK